MSSTTYNIEWQEYPDAVDATLYSGYDVCWYQSSPQYVEYSFPVSVEYANDTNRTWPGSSILTNYLPYTTIPNMPMKVTTRANVLSYPASENIKNDLIRINGVDKIINYTLYTESSTDFTVLNWNDNNLSIKAVDLRLTGLTGGIAESPDARLSAIMSDHPGEWYKYWPGPNGQNSMGNHTYSTRSNIFVEADGSPNLETDWHHLSSANYQKWSFHTNYQNTLNRAITIKGQIGATGLYNNSTYDYAAVNQFSINGVPLTLSSAVNGLHAFEVTIPINNSLTISDTKYPINLSWTGTDAGEFSCNSDYYRGQGLCFFLELKHQSNSSSDYVERINLDFETPNNKQDSATQQLYAIDWEITELKYK